MAKKRKMVIGLDLGGTKIMAAVLDGDFKIAARTRKRTKAERGSEIVLERMVSCIKAAIEKAGVRNSDIRGIGVGSPGPLDPEKGIIIDSPNIKFKDFPLKARLEKAFGVPVSVDNDVNMGLYGEYHFGAAKGYRHVAGLFPGTGIGGGLILDGKLYRGATGNAGEIGHMIVQVDGPLCGCGQYGCIEALASRSSISKEAAVIASRGAAPSILKEAGTDFAAIKSGALARALKAGDGPIEKIIHRAAWFLGIAMANVVNILSPEIIVLGGGLVEAMPDFYIKAAAKSMKNHALPFLVKNVQVARAELGDDAVVMGAAELITEALAKQST